MPQRRARLWSCAGIACVLGSCAPALPPVEPLAGDLREAIWSDINSSRWLYNGDPLAADWYAAGSSEAGVLDHHLRDLRCRGDAKPYRCTFSLLRDVPTSQAPDAAPARLSCWALFERTPRWGWTVKHYPSEGWVHTQSTMSCRRVGR